MNLLIILTLLGVVGLTYAAKCSSNEYCPGGWTVLRRSDQSAHTCDPMTRERKCPKPHTCVHSKCGIAFCCGNPEALRRWNKEKEIEKEMEEDDGEL